MNEVHVSKRGSADTKVDQKQNKWKLLCIGKLGNLATQFQYASLFCSTTTCELLGIWIFLNYPASFMLFFSLPRLFIKFAIRPTRK